MKNSTLFILTGIVVMCMLVLLGINMTSLMTNSPSGQTFIGLNDVRGVDVIYQNTPYTLNFKQQNDLINIFNRSVKVVGVNLEKREKAVIDKITIYRFDLPDITITPIAYIDGNLVYSAPDWNKEGYLMELSDGYLHQLISQSYDS